MDLVIGILYLYLQQIRVWVIVDSGREYMLQAKRKARANRQNRCTQMIVWGVWVPSFSLCESNVFVAVWLLFPTVDAFLEHAARFSLPKSTLATMGSVSSLWVMTTCIVCTKIPLPPSWCSSMLVPLRSFSQRSYIFWSSEQRNG